MFICTCTLYIETVFLYVSVQPNDTCWLISGQRRGVPGLTGDMFEVHQGAHILQVRHFRSDLSLPVPY